MCEDTNIMIQILETVNKNEKSTDLARGLKIGQSESTDLARVCQINQFNSTEFGSGHPIDRAGIN